MNVTKANEAALSYLAKEPAAVAVTVEFTSILGNTKWLRVWRDGRIDVLDVGHED